MKTLPLKIDDELDALLESISNQQGTTKANLVTDIVRKHLETERLKQSLADPDLIRLYQELAPDDTVLAEEGMAEYQRLLESSDQP